MRRHPRSTLLIETHVGIGAPSELAVPYCVSRGATIAAFLVWYHNVAVERLTVRAWGTRVTKHARRSTHPNGDVARAGYGWGELLLELDDTQVPCRPDYYGHGVGCACELGGTHDDGMLASKVSDELPRIQAFRRVRPAASAVALVRRPRTPSSSEPSESEVEEEQEVEEAASVPVI